MTAPLLAGILAMVAGVASSARLVRRHPRTLVRTNHAGREVPALLGISVVGSALGAAALATFVDLRALYPALFLAGLALAVGMAGLADDAFASGPRGLGGHIRSLLRGRVTTGIVKLVVVVVAAAAFAMVAGGGVVRVAASVVLIAAATNVWNALDVRPGRALKATLILVAVLMVPGWRGSVGVVLAACLGAAVAGLPFDLGERAMLGDAGSNPLGFMAGMGLASVLPTPGVVAAALVLLALQAAAETVTLSRIIDAAPPLRWADRLGRKIE